MKKIILIISVLFLMVSCKQKELPVVFMPYDETSEIAALQDHKIKRMQLKLIQSKYLDMNEVFKPFEAELASFSEEDYYNLEPYIIEQDIPSIQESVKNGILSYEKIALFYLFRIRKYESNNDLSLHNIIALNPELIEQAREKDKHRIKNNNYSIYGLPILLKDNINTIDMPTTAGAFALMENKITDDAFIVKKLKENGALILGKVNLSEWAYFFCGSCPVGYSAIGGQTLNPYGRKIFETGGSSSGSGVGVAVNYAIAAVGTETSGSILSPSGKNSVVGLKPTVGLLSRSGIVPISSTLDTPGPMTKNVIDNAILLAAMTGEDINDEATQGLPQIPDYLKNLKSSTLAGKRIGVMKSLLNDSIYKVSVKKIKVAGAVIIEYEEPKIALDGFTTLLNIDMRNDLRTYLKSNADPGIQIKTVNDIIEFNLLDTLKRAPYGQRLFEGIIKDTTSTEEFERIKLDLHAKGKMFFETPMKEFSLDAILSINNYHAGFAAVAKYPCLTVPMGYKGNGEPLNITFISEPYSEQKLIRLGYAFEHLTKARKLPKNYK